MKKIKYTSLDRFIEDTKSYHQFVAINLSWPFHGAIILYRHTFPDFAIYSSRTGKYRSIRFWKIEIETVRKGGPIEEYTALPAPQHAHVVEERTTQNG